MSVQVKGSGTIGGIDEGLNITGIVTATSFVGSGANLTNLPSQLTIANNADNRVITGGSGTNLNGEANVQIDSSGRLMIGNTNAATMYQDGGDDLVIGNTTGSHGMTILSANDNRGRIMFGDTYTSGTGTYAGQVLYDHQTETMNFYANHTNNSAVKMQLGGDHHQLFVGIDKGSTATFDNRSAYFHRSNGNYVSVTTGTAESCGIVFGDTIANNTGNYETYIQHVNNTNELRLRVNQGADNRFLSVKQTGNVEIGNGDLVMASGHGIDFSATGNISGTSSELLDDYEEGSWTPVVQGWDTFTPYSGSSYYQGWYVKVGGMVHCGWKIYIQHLTTPSSNAHVRIHGLPFTSRAVAAGPVAVMRFDIVETGVTNNQWNYMGGNSNTIYLYKQTNGGNGANAINASQNYSNMWTMGTATYATDS